MFKTILYSAIGYFAAKKVYKLYQNYKDRKNLNNGEVRNRIVSDKIIVLDPRNFTVT